MHNAPAVFFDSKSDNDCQGWCDLTQLLCEDHLRTRDTGADALSTLDYSGVFDGYRK